MDILLNTSGVVISTSSLGHKRYKGMMIFHFKRLVVVDMYSPSMSASRDGRCRPFDEIPEQMGRPYRKGR